MKKFTIAALLIFCFFFSAYAAEEKKALTKEQAMELAKVLARQDPFLSGPDVKHAPETIGKFFKKEIYEGLRGNPFMGYYYEEGGKYTGEPTKTYWIDVVSGLDSAKGYIKVIESAFEKLAETNGFQTDPNSPNRIGFFAIQVHPAKTETTHPGIVAEMYIQNRKNGTVLYTRQYEGNLKGPEAAIVDVCDYAFFLIDNEMKKKGS